MTPILVLLLVSGVIAYIGDYLGTLVGKRRLSVFGLRPRVTALVVAVGTGMSITLLTLTVAAILSDNVKIALFSVQQLTHDVESLTAERKRLSEEVQDLQNRVRSKEQEIVVFRKNEPIFAQVVPGGRVASDVRNDLDQFIRELSQRARSRGLLVKDEAGFFAENSAQIDRMAGLIATSPADIVVGAVADENIALGEALGKVKFIVRPNTLIFHAGQEIASLEVDGTRDRPEIARTIQDFMDEINHEVVRAGMIANPLTGRFGNLSSESMLSFFDMVNQIRSLGRRLTLAAVVKEDTYAIGPLNVSFRIAEESGND
ncbi:MAG TPA: DUF3084 domain-containing protein [Candidatus Ozemobacteraceae bacterium]|nr:DUF3084 domain-containing protein [Candidatus Ozemobacteraceae bacterium]